jgi:hypothetical protein
MAELMEPRQAKDLEMDRHHFGTESVAGDSSESRVGFRNKGQALPKVDLGNVYASDYRAEDGPVVKVAAELIETNPPFSAE